MKYLLFCYLLALATYLPAQNTIKMSAVRGNNYGVSYTLPKTVIVIQADVTKTTRTVGELYQYAERFLNISNPISKSEEIYSLDNITATSIGIPNKDQSYLVEFKSNSIAPYVTLTEDGLLCTINAEAEFVEENKIDSQAKDEKKVLNPKSFLTEEILRTGSTSKQAEMIAKQIYLLRETRTNILTGEADNMPPDGNAYKIVMDQINSQEKALTSMFVGTETTSTLSKTFTIIPDEKDINKQIIFRFSQKLGIVSAEDLSGAPIYISLKNKEPKEEIFLTDKEKKALEKKFSSGIIYNIPAKADLKIEYANKVMDNKTIDVVQFGTQEVLVPKELEYKKDRLLKIIFYPHLGAIKSISEGL